VETDRAEPVALADRCCHPRRSCAGYCEPGRLILLSGWEYDSRGRVIRVPQARERSIAKTGMGVPRFHAEERYGYAWVRWPTALPDRRFRGGDAARFPRSTIL